MERPTEFGRRGFIKSIAATGAGLSISGAAERGPGYGRPKIGCCSFCFHKFAAGEVMDEAIDIIGRMGFEGIELIINAREDIANYWTDRNIGELRKKLDTYGLTVSQLAIFQPVVEGLTSLNSDERNRSLDYFEAGCRIAKKIGAHFVNIVAPWPREFKGPGSYLPRYYDLPEPKPGQKYRFDIASGFDWDAVWKGYIGTTKACLERAKRHGTPMTLEHHTHTMIPDATAFLRLWDAVRDPMLGYNLDVGWTMSQREYPPVAIHKARKHLKNLHMRDIDGMMRRFVHIGEGVMDFKGIVDTLKSIGFSGFMSLEQDKFPGDMKQTCARYLAMMKEYVAG